MSSFKRGDRVRVIQDLTSSRPYKSGDIGTVDENQSDYPWVTFDNGSRHVVTATRLERLITKGGDMQKPYQRKTYKLIKELPELKKGALLQEKCDDGTQDFKALDHDFIKYTNEDGDKDLEYPRQAVENEPSYFVEVFKVTPEYLTREELNQWEEFKLAHAKPRRAKRTIAKPPKAVKAKKPARATKAKAA